MTMVTLTVDVFVHDPAELIMAAQASNYLSKLDISHTSDLLPDDDLGRAIGTALRILVFERPHMPGCDLLAVKSHLPSAH